MPLPDPKLDDRRFQDLVDEAKSLIPRYCPEWTDHNVSDPGVTLIELFAWMTDVLLYRVNRVPEKNYIRFLDMLGIRLRGAVPARTGVTFWFSAPQDTAMSIPRGTEVATVRSETQKAVVFTTDEAVDVPVPALEHVWTSVDGEQFVDQTAKLGLEAEYFPVFGKPPVPGNSLYFGFESDLSRCVLRLQALCRLEGVGVDPRNPPLVWEAWCGEAREWDVAHVERDGTGGLNKSGEVVLHLPRDMARQEVNGTAAYWVRLRLVETVGGQKPYSDSPEVSALLATTLGGTAMATHAQVVEREVLGRSSGKPGQTFTLHQHPVLARQEGEALQVENEDKSAYEPWEEVATFADSGPDDRHYTLDSATGEIEFGPRIRQPDGTELPYGRTPPKGRLVRMRAYRFGGGVVGNVGANALTVLKSSIPYVARVQNRFAAVGGLDAERIESAKLRAPHALRARNRAVTAEDFEYLARQASQSVARARCLPSAASGGVDVLIVPAVLAAGGQLRLESLTLPPELREEVERFLDDRRLITTRLRVDMPAYIGVSVDAEVVVEDHVDPARVEQEIVRALRRRMDPLVGGPDARGWPFGRDLYQSELLAEVQKVDGVEFVRSMEMSEVDPRTGEERTRPGSSDRSDLIELPEDALLLPQMLRVQCVPRLALGG